MHCTLHKHICKIFQKKNTHTSKHTLATWISCCSPGILMVVMGLSTWPPCQMSTRSARPLPNFLSKFSLIKCGCAETKKETLVLSTAKVLVAF